MMKSQRSKGLIISAVLITLGIGLGVNALGQSRADFNTDDLQITWPNVRAGGPPKDGIPALTEPPFAPVSDAAHVSPDDRVVVITVGGETRAYPLSILNWHEAVNDVVGERPVLIVYCPLCDSVSVMERRMNDEVMEFGISGLLYESNVLLYDRTHEALWSQVGMEAVSGPYAGQALPHLPWSLMSYAEFAEQYPQAHVLSMDTGHARNYERNPYQSYLASDRLMFPVSRKDDRMPNKEPIIGIRAGDTTRAYKIADIRKAPGGRVEDLIRDRRVVLEADDNGRVSVTKLPASMQAIHTFWFTWAAIHSDTGIHNDTGD